MNKIYTSFGTTEVEVGRTYDYFDDGKVREDRQMSVEITEIIPFDKISHEVLAQWKDEVEHCDWLYSPETDYFVKGELKTCNEETVVIHMVRTRGSGWFGLGYWAGRLDYDGSLLHIIYDRRKEQNENNNL